MRRQGTLKLQDSSEVARRGLIADYIIVGRTLPEDKHYADS
jgi:hypothetical protein